MVLFFCGILLAIGPHIIITPKSTLSNWKREFEKWCPTMKVMVFHGTKEERQSMIKDIIRKHNFEVLITTYEMCLIEKSILKRIKWIYLIIDEGHRIKNEESSLSILLREFSTQFRLVITGTPLQVFDKESRLWNRIIFMNCGPY